MFKPRYGESIAESGNGALEYKDSGATVAHLIAIYIRSIKLFSKFQRLRLSV